MTPRRRSLAALTAAAAALALLLAGCATTGGDADHPAETSASTGTAAWPRTVEIPTADGASRTVTIPAEPRAIAALDYESAEVLAELGLADRLVLIPEAVTNPAVGGHVDEMLEVPHTFPVAANLEAETVISAAPDLVVMSPRHGAGDTIGAVLEQAGLTVLQLPDAWTDPESAFTNIALIGQSTGTESTAEQLVDDLSAGLAEQAAETPGSALADPPRVLVLTNQAGRPFVTAGDAYPLHLLDLAGATAASDDLGIRITGPISVEQVLEAAPDGIVLIDMNGSGDRIYAEMLANPAVAALPAIAEGRVLRITGIEVQALGLRTTIDGLEALTSWVAALR